MRSSNPVFKESIYEQAYPLTERPMTAAGTMNKLLILSLVMMLGAGAVYYQFFLGHIDFVSMLVTGGIIAGFILGLVAIFNIKLMPYLAPLYAFSQGAALSGISCFFEQSFPGIVIQAVSMTFIVVFVMAVLYKAGLIQATEKFRSIVFTASMAIMIFYIIAFVLSFFHVNVPYFYVNSPLNIGINIAIAIIAALNLIIDFDFIEQGVRKPLPSLYEWHGAFGLLVTILWLYIEILRILARTRRR
ncbi:MAG: Bax inhibitor-1/YccA family protein [Candidatus Gastranaerophilales bacterium]|nr:Bax inhibitor-1/YccA family protein [Candidatus Gastranaerophilales bacterium]